MTPPPETLLGRSPRTSTLAVWSLFLGICGIFGFLGVMGIIGVGICSITAIIFGHLSRREIRESGGMLAGKGNAMAGLVMGYTGSLLIVGGFIAGDAALTKAKKVTALAMAVGIESAVNNFHTEIGEMPSKTEIIDTSKDTSLAKALRGDDDPTRNPRKIRFLAVKEAKLNKNGLDPVTLKIFDPWGHGYQVILNTRYTEQITVTRGGTTETLKGRRVVVFSVGKDGVAGTADDVKTW
jgi:hypothetical protein